MKMYLLKTMGGLVPGDPESEEKYKKIKTGAGVSAEVKTHRNYKFLKKFFALLNLAYDYWEPGVVSSKHGTPEKNFDRFRKDAIILAGFYHVTVRLNRETRIEAKSISFASMCQEEFEAVYNGVLNVFLKRIPQMAQMGEDEVNRVVDQLIAFG